MNLLPRQQSAGLLAAPYYMAVGSWFARRRTIEVGLVVGAVTAVLSFLIVDLAAVLYAAATQAWPMPLAWLLAGIAFTIPAAFLGGLCGLLGATVAHSPLARMLHDA